MEFVKKHQHVLIIIAVGFLTFANMLFNNFVWDDKKYIIDNAQIHHIDLVRSFGPNLFNAVGQYRPIPEAYFSIVYTLFTNTPFFYHLIQLAIHLSAAVIFYLILQKFVSSKIALFSTLIFLVHPMQVEAVSYIGATLDPLFVLFGLIALHLATKKLDFKKLGLIFLFALLSILTKETGIFFFGMIGIFIYFFNKKYAAASILFGAVTTVLYFLLRFGMSGVFFTSRKLVPIAGLSLLERITNIPQIAFYYLKTFLFPLNLAIDQQWTVSTLTAQSFFLPLVIELVILGCMIAFGAYMYGYSRKNLSGYLFFAFWFFAGLSIYLQIIPLDFTVTDRWFYFPMMGLLGMIGVIAQSVHHRIRKVKTPVTILFLCILVLLMGRTLVRNTNWRDSLTLYSHDIELSDNFDIENSLGLEYFDRKEYPQALQHLSQSALQRPNEFNFHNLGVLYESQGNVDQARRYFGQVFTLKDYQLFLPHAHDINSYKSYATILVYDQKAADAEVFIANALRDYPDSADLWMFLALAKLTKHDSQGALDAAQRAYQLSRDDEKRFVYEHIANKQAFSINLIDKSIRFE